MNKEIKLEKKLSPMNVWALAFGCIIGWGAFVMPGNIFLPNAGPLGTAIGMLIAALIMIIIACNYNYMINKYPIAGGEFTYTKYSFGDKHAFVCAWFLSLSYATLVPMNATALALIGRNLMGKVFQFGYLYTVSGYDIYLGELLLALGALIIFGTFSIKGVKFAGNLQVLLTIALAGSVTIIGVAALLSPHATLSHLSPSFHPGSSTFSGVLAVLAVSPYCFVGFDTIPQSAEEFNFSVRKTRLIMIISILFGCLVYVVLNTVTAAVVPDGYTNWSDYIDHVSSLNGLESLPTFHAAYQLLGIFGLIFLGIAVTSAILSGIIGFYMATSRILYSMSVEGVIPKWFGVLDEKTKTPKNAILFHMALALIAPFFGRNALTWLVDMTSLGAAIGYGYTSAAAILFARRENNKGIVITGIIGTIMAIILALILLVPIPVLNCSLGKESYFCLVAWILLGLIFYFSPKKKLA
ncbi:MAG: APC family permease [Eubacteriales bacterium]|nr:APC family permease [Eubacteriales bacterium]